MKRILLFLILVPFYQYIFGQATQGSIVFVAFDTDVDDGLAFLTLQSIDDGITIYFTDSEWNGTSFNSGEGVVTWINNTGASIQEGQIIIMTDLNTTPSVNLGIISESGSFDLSGMEEAVYAFVGLNPSTPTTFLAAISNEAYDDGTTVGSLTNTGLTEGVTATNIDTNRDVAIFNGTVDCSGDGDITTCAARINVNDASSSSDWQTEDGTGDQSTNNVSPDFPVDVPSSSDFTIPSTYGNLPITLLSFNAQKINQQVALSWETATEINNDYMAVERSQDGRTFVEIGRVQGAGTTTTPQNYRFIDEAPLAGVNYYRLRQVDFDGRTEYHQVVSVNMGGATSSIRILPNPVNDFTSLQLDQAFEQDTEVRIYDLTGRVVFANNWAAGQQQLDLNLSFLANGSYVIRIENQEEIITERFVKQ